MWKLNLILIMMISLIGIAGAELTSKNKWVLDKYDGAIAGNFTTDMKTINPTDARICLYPKAILSASSSTLISTNVYLKKDSAIANTYTLSQLEVNKTGLNVNSICINISSKTANYIRIGDASIIYIYLTGAEELDSSRDFIRDIFGYVGFLDGNYTLIDNGNFIKAIFEKNLTSKNDIRILAKSNATSSIDVYLNNEVIANISNISKQNYYSTYLTGLGSRTSNTFFLKCNGQISFDYIIDPAFCGGNLNCNIWNGYGNKATCESHSTLCLEQGFTSCDGTAVGACSIYTAGGQAVCELAGCVWNNPNCEGNLPCNIWTNEADCINIGGPFGCSLGGYLCSNKGGAKCSDLTDEPTCTSYNDASCVWDATSPLLSFITPTPANNSGAGASIIINVSISENNLNSAWVQFDSTNYTLSCSGTSPDYVCNKTFSGLAVGQHNFTAYANDTGNQVGQTEKRTVYVLCASTGNCNIDCAGNYSITNNINIPANLSFTGAGEIRVYKNLALIPKSQIYIGTPCRIYLNQGTRISI